MPMKLGLGLYRHMLNPEYYAFAVQAGCTHVIIHLVDYFKQGAANPSNNQPTGGKDQPWGLAGDPDRLWTAAEMKALRKQVEAAGLKIEGIENLDPAHWYDILLDGPKPSPASAAASADPSRAAAQSPLPWMGRWTRPCPTAWSGT
jgi:mannonate dehydratase